MRFVTFGAASARFCPAERAAVSAERPVLHELCLVDGNVAGCKRMHVHGIGRAIQLAHEARLTLVGARDDGNAPFTASNTLVGQTSTQRSHAVQRDSLISSIKTIGPVRRSQVERWASS